MTWTWHDDDPATALSAQNMQTHIELRLRALEVAGGGGGSAYITDLAGGGIIVDSGPIQVEYNAGSPRFVEFLGDSGDTYAGAKIGWSDAWYGPAVQDTSVESDAETVFFVLSPDGISAVAFHAANGGVGKFDIHAPNAAPLTDNIISAQRNNDVWPRVQIQLDGGMAFGDGTAAPGVIFAHGTGTPEGAVTGAVGSLYLRTDGSTSTTLYVKTSGTGNTGWTAK